MKKIPVLLLLLAAALLISCSAALASPIDGTWKLSSGTLEVSLSSVSGAIQGTEPDPISIQALARSGGKYAIRFGGEIKFDGDNAGMSIPDMFDVNVAAGIPGASGVDFSQFGIKAPDAEKYTFNITYPDTDHAGMNATTDFSVELLDNDTLELKYNTTHGLGEYDKVDAVFSRAGNTPVTDTPDQNPSDDTPDKNPGGIGSGNGGGGCDAGIGLFGLLPLAALMFAGRKNHR